MGPSRILSYSKNYGALSLLGFYSEVTIDKLLTSCFKKKCWSEDEVLDELSCKGCCSVWSRGLFGKVEVLGFYSQLCQ